MVASVEVQRRVQRPSSEAQLLVQPVRNSAPWSSSRNLLVDDPSFSEGRGNLLTREDLERWQDTQFKTLRNVSNRPSD